MSFASEFKFHDMKLKKLFRNWGPGFFEISLLKYITSWKYQIVAHGMDKKVDTKKPVDIIMYLKVKKTCPVNFRATELVKG